MAKLIEVPDDLERKELFAFLLLNKDALIRQKKLEYKKSDGFAFTGLVKEGAITKTALASGESEKGTLLAKVVINTTNYMDSRKDVHLPGLWTKSLSENKSIMHLQEHSMEFSKIISSKDDLKAYTKSMTWKSLGYDLKGKTEALIFDSTVRLSRNAFMYDQYDKGYVDNHSVGMQYVKMILCVNEPDDTYYGAEYEAWEKYIKEVVNKADAEQSGYFWAVTEAKVIEGSAVPIGANTLTPTISITSKSNEPSKDTTSIYDLNISTPDKGSWIEKQINLSKI